MNTENKTNKKKIEILVNYYNIRNYDKVIEEANRILKKNPNIDILWNLLGLSYQQQGDYDSAEKNFIRTLQINPENISAINNLANNYKYIKNFNKADEYFKKALERNPKYVNALVNYGNLKFELNKFSESLNYLNQALEINDKLISVHTNLALVHQSLGDFKKSLFHLNKINELKPEFTRADKMISALIDYKDDDNHQKLMLNKLNNLSLSDEQKVFIYFALAKANEDKKDYKRAFECMEKGNEIKRGLSNYNISKDESLFNNIKKLFYNYNFNEISKIKEEKKIIFIIGMPRSGTTLVEQIISSHPDVGGMGELNTLNNLINNDIYKKDKKNFKDTLSDIDLDAISVKYFNYIKNFNINQKSITDKTLFNFQWIGFIKILFPNSKIISCVRKPKDNCLSIYKNLFDHEGGWCYNKSELIQFYKLYEDLMKFWKSKIPDFIYEVNYEKLIQEPSTVIKELINTCDLKWNDQCLKFYENKSAIKTLSVNQARQKIYSSSVNSYDNYKLYSKSLFKDFD